MNKYLIVLMAICLVSVHAFVKRDAPEQNPNYLEDIQKQLQSISNTISEKVKETFNPEDIKKSIDQFVASANKMITTSNEPKAQ